jgi:hypothetical protein
MILLAAFFCTATSVLSNVDVQRKYVVADNLISVSVLAEVHNSGDSPETVYPYRLTPREGAHAGIFIASSDRAEHRDFKSLLTVTRQDSQNYLVTLPSPLAPGKTQIIYLSYTLGNYFLFLKPTIQLNQRIGLFFNTTLFYQGPIETRKSSLTIDGISKSSISRKSSPSGLKVSGTTLSIFDLTVATPEDFEVEFATSRPLPYIATIQSRTSVSHWGRSKQSAYYEVQNAGPKFVGEFNRIDFRQDSPCFIQSVPLRPPAGASNFWARDEGGQLEREIPYTGNGELLIPLRGPMMSSWKATFTTGWTLRTSVFVSGGYVFKSDLIVGGLAAPIGKVTADIILPEGAKITDVQIPIPVNQTTYREIQSLDWDGRVVVHIEAENLASRDRIPVKIEYQLAGSENFKKIGLLAGAFSVIFLAITLGRKIDCGIHVGNASSQ